MARRTPNYRLVKQNRTYSIEEVAVLFGLHRNTVRNWFKDGLRTIDDCRPLLIHGGVLAEFLMTRRKATKRPCGPGRIYCLRCREPRVPHGNAVTYKPLHNVGGMLIGVCPDCGTRLFRRVSEATLASSVGHLEVRFTEAQEHIGESPVPSVNCDFNKGGITND